MMAPAFAANGDVWAAYAKTALITQTVTSADTVIDGVPDFGQTDLYVLSHRLGRDLAVASSDISFQPANPEPGGMATIQAVIHNRGDLEAHGVQVTFSQGSALLGTRTLNLAGMATDAVSLNWSVPAQAVPQQISVAVDPASLINDSDRSNNQVSVIVPAPDLVAARMWTDDQPGHVVMVTALISNTGAVASGPFSVMFRLDNPVTGPVIGQSSLAGLSVGAIGQAQILWDSASTASGWHSVYAIADPEAKIVESDETNNSSRASVALLPDLRLRPSDIYAAFTASGVDFTVTVSNQGPRDARADVGLYDRRPAEAGSPLTMASVDVPAGMARPCDPNVEWELVARAISCRER